ncbi:MAG: hypothetical protein K2H45_04275 [Acetatifactor sp.]|nr:hypothetical protein [Acetatifactor sp.]
MVDADETRRRKARELRYRKAIVKDVNLDKIWEDLWEIQEACNDVRWYFEVDGDEETLLNALNGNEDEAYEFRMMFSDLSAECEKMREDLQEEYIPECFDTFFTAVNTEGTLLGWDPYEGDYMGLGSSFEDEKAVEEAKKKMQRKTKDQILEIARYCFKIFQAYIGIRHRYDCLKAAMDILKDENTGYIQMVKQIEEVYEKAAKDGFYGGFGPHAAEFDRLISCMPQEAWIQ